MKQTKTIYRVVRIDFEYDGDRFDEEHAATAASNIAISNALAYEDERDDDNGIRITDLTDCGESA